jgi:hypothetical protein
MMFFQGFENIPGAPGNVGGLAQSFLDSPSIGQDETLVAGYLTDSDKQILSDHAKILRQQGTRTAAKELDRMNKMYAQYGLSFGNIKLPGI